MKRSIAVVLVASMALQASGCTTTSPVVPMRTVAQDVPTTVRGGATPVAANQNPNQAVAAPASIPLDVPTSEFLGGRAAGILAGLALIGVIALVFFTGGKDSRGGGAGGDGPTVPTVPTTPTTP